MLCYYYYYINYIGKKLSKTAYRRVKHILGLMHRKGLNVFFLIHKLLFIFQRSWFAERFLFAYKAPKNIFSNADFNFPQMWST